MANFRCNSCGGTYSDTQADGLGYYHQCPPEVITPSAFDAAGNITKPEKRDPRPDIRDENFVPGIVFLDGKPGRFAPDPADATREKFTPEPQRIKSEGKGRTRL